MEQHLYEPVHEEFRDLCRQFLAREAVPHHARWEAAGLVDREVWRSAGAAGLLGMDVDAEYGGGGQRDFRFNAVLAEEIVRAGCPGLGFSLHNDVVAPYLTELTTDDQRKRWLPRFCSGDLVTAIAMSEPGAGSDLAGVRTGAVRDGDHWVLDGQKTFITNGELADLVIVVVRTDPERGAHGVSLVAVETGTPGLSRGRRLEKVGLKANDTAELFFDDCRVPAENLIGTENHGFYHLMANLPRERLSIAVSAVAAAERLLALTLDHARTREAFGRPIGTFQHNRFLLAELDTEVTIARGCATMGRLGAPYRAAVAPPRSPRLATDLTLPAPSRPDVARIQRRTVRLLVATQIIGGIGVTIGFAVGPLFAARMAGTAVAGLAQSAGVVGAGLLAVPITRIMSGHGRRPGLVMAYLVGAVGGVLVVLAAVTGRVPLLFLGILLFGGGSAANLQARYTAVDLAEPGRRGRQLSLVVWATTIGAVAAPNFAALADRTTSGWGLPPLAGPFAFSAAAFALAAGVLLVALRPDPLLTARRLAAAEAPTPGGGSAATGRRGAGLRAAWRVVRERPAARLGIAAVAVGHLVMIAVMSMTPVRLGEYHDDTAVLRVVGIVLSLHIAGMYALSPVVGWLTDRVGRRPVILGGLALLLAACAVAGSAGHHTPGLTVGLVLLGLGWSGTMVAGSTLLSESVPADVRPGVQGLSDLTMGLAGAGAGALSGFVMQVAGYPALTLLAAIATVPLLALALRPAPGRAPDEED
ncbi:alkylation response protein AidB-like acyl-CoA dehydrogenase [Micromonospora olivasterospora]|uniref:Alkylation response protein AidB-like acyl-CoA dehydrogenase n=1 Tax=Micromonospora olivasterospora TaxID=1880 RepID=A0A562IDU0_MICOL|nr:alkylation response protein AidB-like acyl-CoA dehydrogenase [Micromonospora olivasterospora]